MADRCKHCGDPADGHSGDCYDCRHVIRETQVPCAKCRSLLPLKRMSTLIARIQHAGSTKYRNIKVRYCATCSPKAELALAQSASEQDAVVHDAVRARATKVKEQRALERKKQRGRETERPAD